MKVFALNGSPRKKRGNTALILNPFLEGMVESGAEVELFYTRDLDPKACKSCSVCQFNTPGKCIQKDGINEILPKLADADIWVLASPVYLDSVTGPMKNFLDRMVPLVQPFYEIRNGHSRMKLREGVKTGDVVFVSTCGLWELDNFDPLLNHVKTLCETMNRKFKGSLLRPHANFLKPMMEMNVPLEDIFKAAKEAGRRLTQEGQISKDNLNIITRELISLKDFMALSKQYVLQELDSSKTKKS